MMYERTDLAPEERDLDALLSAARPVALPVGFRDSVLSRIRSDRRVAWEWIVAGTIAPDGIPVARAAWRRMSSSP